jgi:hypothetical protein
MNLDITRNLSDYRSAGGTLYNVACPELTNERVAMVRQSVREELAEGKSILH